MPSTCPAVSIKGPPEVAPRVASRKAGRNLTAIWQQNRDILLPLKDMVSGEDQIRGISDTAGWKTPAPIY
jgi:hypothetical protein